MSELNVRSDAVDVEQIMRQIRTRIREKRGVDYTEAELQQLAKVKLEKFPDPRGVRSDLVDQFRSQRVVAPAPPNYEFGEETMFETHRGVLRSLRKLLQPILKLFFNPDKITSALHIQAQVNTQGETRLRRLEEREPIHYELLHNLTVEVTRLGIEVHNLKMRVESLSSRMDFDERRSRSLESVVQYRQPQQQPRPQIQAPQSQPGGGSTQQSPQGPRPESSGMPAPGPGQQGTDGSMGGGERRRRRRRRRRRPGQTMGDGQQQGQWNGQRQDGAAPPEAHESAINGPAEAGFDGEDDGPEGPGGPTDNDGPDDEDTPNQ